MSQKHQAPGLRAAYDEALTRMDAEIGSRLAKLPLFARREMTPALEAVRGFLDLVADEHVRTRRQLDELADYLEADLEAESDGSAR